MAEKIDDVGRTKALEAFGVRLLPSPDECGPHLISASVPYGPFVEGDYITICLTAESHLRTGGADVVATAADILFPIGVHDFVVPADVTHVALISTWSGATAAVWKSSR